MVHVASVATAAGDHNYDDNNNIHERPLQDVGFFFSGTYSYMCWSALLLCIRTIYTINNQ